MKRDAPAAKAEFGLGGVRWPRPFRIRRLGHFGVNVADPEASRDFYCRLVGFRLSDRRDFTHRLTEDKRASVGPTLGYFARNGTDPHSSVFLPRGAYATVNAGASKPQGTVNQITWQVGSLQEISDAFDWFTKRGKPIRRAGRDLPGSNWHFYPPDPEGHTNELYYGIEQIGWDGYSKPREMYGVRYAKPPELPHKSELAEVLHATAEGIPIEKGLRVSEVAAEKYDVGGILLARPFKIVRHGPVRLFAADMEAMVNFYPDDLGLTVTEEVEYRGQRCVFLRANTKHHRMGLYPVALRGEPDDGGKDSVEKKHRIRRHGIEHGGVEALPAFQAQQRAQDTARQVGIVALAQLEDSACRLLEGERARRLTAGRGGTREDFEHQVAERHLPSDTTGVPPSPQRAEGHGVARPVSSSCPPRHWQKLAAGRDGGSGSQVLRDKNAANTINAGMVYLQLRTGLGGALAGARLPAAHVACLVEPAGGRGGVIAIPQLDF